MKIVIVGCGIIGEAILDNLVKEHHEITALDIDRSVMSHISDAYDVMTLCGSGTDYEKLKEAGVDKADLFIAVTGSDEYNMLACFSAKKLGAKKTIARIRDVDNGGESLTFLKKQLDLSFVFNPEQLTAKAILDIIRLPSASKVETFGTKKFGLIRLTLKENSPIDGKTLIQLRNECKERFLICTVERNGQVYIPRGNFALKAGDVIGVMTVGNDIRALLKYMGFADKQVRNIIILGASRTSLYLSELLTAIHCNVKIIDKDQKACEEACTQLGGVSVVYGDGMAHDILDEEGITDADAFISLTGADAENIVTSVYANSQHVGKVITKLGNAQLISMANSLSLDTVISPQNIVANIVVSYARALNEGSASKMETLYRIAGGKAEALEFNVLAESEYTGKPLKELKVKENVIIAGITRDKTAFIPSGEDQIQVGDRVVIIAGEQIYDLADIVE